jgi:hypothetical protein
MCVDVCTALAAGRGHRIGSGSGPRATGHRSMTDLKTLSIWKAKAEPECRFFAWNLLRKRILTANSLLQREAGPMTRYASYVILSWGLRSTHLCIDCSVATRSKVYGGYSTFLLHLHPRLCRHTGSEFRIGLIVVGCWESGDLRVVFPSFFTCLVFNLTSFSSNNNSRQMSRHHFKKSCFHNMQLKQ